MKMTKVEFQVLLDKYLNGLASPHETKLLDQFFDSYHKKPVAVGEVSEEIREEILQNIQAAIGVDIRNTNSKFGGLGVWLRAAAVISFVLITSYFLLDRFGLQDEKTQPLVAKVKSVRASKGQKLDIRLPDGSRIKLNANSKISYPEKFAGDIREVTLDGEAYFDVTHIPSRPFIVHTPYASTQVLGTSFNVLHAGEATTITLVEGKVNVSLPNGQTALLTPNRQATIGRDAQRIDTQQVDVEKYVGWKNNTLHFNNITVREAFAAMENWYNVDIEVNNPAVMNCIINSKYQNESLENVLNSFRFMLKMDFKINGQQVTVSGKGCP
jgi:transmembrane sensor